MNTLPLIEVPRKSSCLTGSLALTELLKERSQGQEQIGMIRVSLLMSYLQVQLVWIRVRLVRHILNQANYKTSLEAAMPILLLHLLTCGIIFLSILIDLKIQPLFISPIRHSISWGVALLLLLVLFSAVISQGKGCCHVSY